MIQDNLAMEPCALSSKRLSHQHPSVDGKVLLSSTTTDSSPDIIIKKEADTNFPIKPFIPHRIDNRAPLWTATPQIKQEINQSKHRHNCKTLLYTETKLSSKIKKHIIKQIENYKLLGDNAREKHLESRMKLQKSDGISVPALEGQNEVVAARHIACWEVLGHYAGKYFIDADYNQGASAVGASLLSIDTYSYSAPHGKFISGFRCGNITSCINACRTYELGEEEDKLPKQNVCFIQHYDAQGVMLPFVISTKDIRAGDVLRLDYGKEYWTSKRACIEVSDNSDSEEEKTAASDCTAQSDRLPLDSGDLTSHVSVQTNKKLYGCPPENNDNPSASTCCSTQSL